MPISTKLSTKHPWVNGSQVCSNEGLCPFPRGDDNEIANIHVHMKFKNPVLKIQWAKHPCKHG